MGKTPIIMCASQPGSFSIEQLKHFMRNNVVVAFPGYDEIGLSMHSREYIELLCDKFSHLPHIMPVKVTTHMSAGNDYKWDRIISDWANYGPVNPIIYAMDEPFNRGLHGCPCDPYTQREAWIAWKISQLHKCQAAVENFTKLCPGCRPFITSDRPVPPGGAAVTADLLVRAYDLRLIEMAVDFFGINWRKVFKMEDTYVGGYLIHPLFGQGYSPKQIADCVHMLGLDFFLYFWAESPELWRAGRATPEMIELVKAI